MLLRSVLGVALLSDVSFQSTYPNVHQFPIASAGLSPLNTSVVNTNNFNTTATADFWWYFPAFLTDNRRVWPMPSPPNCFDAQCNSYFLPGSMSGVQLDPNLPPIASSDYPKAISWIQNDAPGYQFDFSPIDRVKDPSMTLDDCRVYGTDFLAVQLCLKNADSSILAGTLLEDLADNSMECMSVRCQADRQLLEFKGLEDHCPVQHQDDNLKTSRNNCI